MGNSPVTFQLPEFVLRRALVKGHYEAWPASAQDVVDPYLQLLDVVHRPNPDHSVTLGRLGLSFVNNSLSRVFVYYQPGCRSRVAPVVSILDVALAAYSIPIAEVSIPFERVFPSTVARLGKRFDVVTTSVDILPLEMRRLILTGEYSGED
ncbi:MAG TPA: hypothetical protein VJB87_01360 [Candidatus Nanoarchaeia archaeon]|nr:hypothetical protein [Candidatus Nanoarchaeia archaeon]